MCRCFSGSFDVLFCLTCLQVHRFMIKVVFQVFTTFREGLHPLSFTHLFWIWTIQTRGIDSVHRGCNIPDYKYGESIGEQNKISVDLIFLSPWTPVRIQDPVSNSLQSDLPSDLVKFGLKLSDLFRSELFRPYMLFFTVNSSVFTLIW